MIDFAKLEPRLIGQAQTKQPVQKVTPSTVSNELVFETITIQESGLRRSANAAAKLNDIAAVFVVVFLLVGPVPIGANHPLAWLGFAAAISVFVGLYALSMFYIDPGRLSRTGRYRAIVGLGVGLILFCAAQLLPFSFSSLAELPERLLPDRLTVSAPATALGVIRIFSYALLFVLVLEISANTNRAAWLLKCMFYIIVVHAAWSLISLSLLGDTLLLSPKTAYEGFATGFFVNRNSFATYLSMGLMIGFGKMLFLLLGPTARSAKRPTLIRRLSMDFFIQASLSGVILAALLATGSRLGVFSALLGGLFLFSSMLLKANSLPRWKVAAVLLSTAVVACFAIVMAAPNLASRLVFFEHSIGLRVELYRQTLEMIFHRPWFGYGLDSFAAAFELFHKPSLLTGFIWDRPHSTYLTLWAELGVVAGSIPLVILGLCFVRMLSQIRVRKNTYLPATVASAVVVVCAVHSLGDFSLEMAANAYLFIVLTGVGISERV
ncbi:O-antigen ligase family protein [Parasedimentitalea huanghaiensis]|uniref:O-antigen ligase-related domain-containing protein n=1 Tax=Parasedimentitalea huanghaiensis TaxID=2682100 RepID=A0A6L6WL58_9RHOB|nr:O-antigen ligase family protein [Zongyanglinia huanghaiensis]MVO18573.1 hypothetical protein [Zongyanglinia huanghaiensis]